MEQTVQKVILLVEDEALIAMATRMQLEKNGYRVVIAGTGEKAVDTAIRTPEIDLVLMDIDLGGGIDGTEAAQRILDSVDIPLVFLSSHTEPAMVERTEGISSYGYIVKNSGDTVLLASIRMAFKLFQANRSIAAQNTRMEATNEELRVANEELRTNNDKLKWWDDIVQYVVEHAPSAIAVLDRDLRFMYVSKRFLTDYSVRDRDIVGRHHYDVFPDIPAKWRDVHQRALEGDVLSSDDDDFVRQDGSIDTTRWQCLPWYEPGGAVGGIILYTEVITEQKRLEQRMRLLAEHAHDLIYRIELVPERRFSYVSPASTRICGYTPEEHYADPDLGFKLVHPDDHGVLERMSQDPRQFDGPVVLRWRRKDGTTIWVEQNNTRVYDGAGELVAIEGIGRDITERVHDAKVTRRGEEYLRTILETTVDGFWVVSEEGIVCDVNAAYCGMSGYSRTELIGMPVHDIDAEEDPADTSARVLRIMSTGSEAFETRHRRKDGSVFDVAVSVTVVRNTDETRLVCFCRDISERKRYESELMRQKTELDLLEKPS